MSLQVGPLISANSQLVSFSPASAKAEGPGHLQLGGCGQEDLKDQMDHTVGDVYPLL